ncbi:hypothetical protein C4J81_15210 [Deltaproteobacteria bacterium Smac51]|nr:hypothetical protein C4J81_15210 [Deltaproteobacteria bacterium Smac51]
MKKYIITAILTAVCSLVMMTGGALAQNSDTAEVSETGPQPKLVIDSLSFEAEDIKPGSLIIHEFIIENHGEADLELKDVRPGCGCSVARYDKIIAPGASGKVDVQIRVYNEWAGQDISKSTWVLSNDPERPQITLTISGRVQAAAGQVPDPTSK